MFRIGIGALGVVTLALASSPASAHITFEKPDATPRAFYKAVLRVPHGCDGQATTAIEVEIPEGIIGAKPMPKPGWALAIEKGPYAKSYAFMHGTLAQGAKAFTWTGGALPDDQYDEFVFQAYVSDAFVLGTNVAFPVTQTCAGGSSVRWIELPEAGQGEHDLKAPAPVLHIVGTDKSAPSMHHH